MEKNVNKVLILCAVLIIAKATAVAPLLGHGEYNKTDVAAQNESTNKSVIDKIKEDSEVKNTNNLKPNKKKYLTGYTTANVEVRVSPDKSSNILETYNFNHKIKYKSYNKEWVEIAYKDSVAYICKDYVSKEKCNSIKYDSPNNNGFKSYMSYSSITTIGSQQDRLQKLAYTGDYGIRMVDGRYCLAIGTAFNSSIGTYFDLVLENGTKIPCVIGDIKSSKHTKSDNITTKSNGCVSEFIVDISNLDSNAKKAGDMSFVCEEWSSPVAQFYIYEKNILD